MINNQDPNIVFYLLILFGNLNLVIGDWLLNSDLLRYG